MESGQRLVANGTRVGEIFTAAGAAFQKIGELAMLLYGNKASRPSVPPKTQEKIHHSLKRFATDLEHISSDIKKKTTDQIKGELKRKFEDDRQVPSVEPPVSPSKQRRLQKSSALSPAQQQLNGSLTEAERIMAQADAERSALLAGMPPPPDDGLLDDGTMVEEIITTETDDGALSDSGPVRGIGVAGSGESSSGEDERVDPNRAKKRSKKRKTKRNEFIMGALRVGDDDDENDHHGQVADLVPDQQLDIVLEESVEVSHTEEEVVHDGLELQFTVSEEEVVAT